jgi:LacI family transcriptional regulator
MPARNSSMSQQQRSGNAILRQRFRVGIRLMDWTHGFAHRIFAGIVDFLRTGVDWELVYDAPSGFDLPPTPVDANWVGDGLITFRHTAEEAKLWRARGVKVVNLSAEVPADCDPFARVTLDNEAVALAAVGHFLHDLGLKDLAFWHDPDRNYSCERWEAFERFGRHAGCRVHLVEVPACRHPPEIRADEISRRAWPQLLRLPKPCGLFAKDDIAATWALRLCRTTGLRCPDDLAVLGVNDDPVFCHTSTPPLSSIRFPGRKVGFIAAELLHRLMTGQDAAGDERIRVAPGPLVPRESTGQPDPGDELVAKALDAIRGAPPHHVLSVPDLCQLVGVSRESLRKRMQAAVGTTPKQEIDRVRLARLKMALVTRDATLESLADEFGFTGAEELCRFFKRLTGTSPGRYRADLQSRH